MSELVFDGDQRIIVTGAFRLAFHWTGARWVHSLELRGQSESSPRVLAVSVEGDPERDNPVRVVSPTYQDLQFQEDGQKIQALLVGRSGPHHFSAVFEVEQRGPEVYVRVDVADRCRSPVEALASTYTLDVTSGELVDARPTLAAWNIGANQLTIATDAWGPTELAVAEAGRRATQVQAFVRIDPAAATHRIKYCWHWDQDIPAE